MEKISASSTNLSTPSINHKEIILRELERLKISYLEDSSKKWQLRALNKALLSIKDYKKEIKNTSTNAATLVQNKNSILIEKDGIYHNQLKEIDNKEKLLLTRSRMLQIAQDRNSYKTKVLYTLMAILIVILIINLIIWAMRGKRGGNSSNK